MVMKLAERYDIPIDPEDITIRQVGQDVVVDMSYTDERRARAGRVRA